jgi:subtilisin family serine protease
MKKKIMLTIILTILVVSITITNAQSNLTKTPTIQIHPEIINEIIKGNNPTAIIEFNNLESKKSIEENQKQIKDLIGKEQKITTYQHLNYLTLTLTQENLNKILDSNHNIKAIHKNYELKPTLAESSPLIQAPQTHRLRYFNQQITGHGQTIAIVDTGIDYTHPDLGGCIGPQCKVIGGYDFYNYDNDPMDNNGHGTHIAGIAAAKGQITGIAPDAKLLAIRVCGGAYPGRCYFNDILSGLNYIAALNNPNITVSMSIGDGGEYNTQSCPRYIDQAIQTLQNQNIQIISSSGNEGHGTGISYPACNPNIISVGATYDANIGGRTYSGTCTDQTTNTDKVTCYSNSANNLDLVAPGSLITSTRRLGGRITYEGTSMATPHVSATIALLKQIKPTITKQEILTILQQTGTPTTDQKNGLTFKRINIKDAILTAIEYLAACNPGPNC